MNQKTSFPELEKILFIKSGIAVGGASFADLAMVSYLKARGHDITLLTGYAQPFTERHMFSQEIPLVVDPVLDRYSDSSPAAIKERILAKVAIGDSVVVFSQALCVAEQQMGEAAIAIADEVPSVFRQHNPVALDLYGSFGNARSGFNLPITGSMDAQLKLLNPSLQSRVLPPLINGNRFEYTGDDRKEARKSVRQDLDLGEQDDAVVILQPTRVSQHKGPEYSLELAIKLERQLAKRCILLIAGGNEPFEAAQALKHSLRMTAKSQNFDGLRFMDGSHANEGNRRISDVMLASDIIALPSTSETFGLGVAEAALSQVPIVTKPYKDDTGNEIFNEVYGDFDVVTDYIDAAIPSDEVVLQLADVIEDKSRRIAMTERNHELALRYTYTDSTHDLLLDVLRSTQ